MKELPGAPALPEGWVYRVVSSNHTVGKCMYYVEPRRPSWFGRTRLVSWAWVVKEPYNTRSFTIGKVPLERIVDAATRAYKSWAGDDVEGDYR